MLRGLLKKDRDFLRILDSAAAAEILKVTLLLSGAKHSPAELPLMPLLGPFSPGRQPDEQSGGS